MGKALIIGAGGVAGVVIHKCCQNSEVFTEICIASRTKSKCDKFKEELQDKTATKITTAQVDANDVDQLIALIEQEKPDIVINVALPYQDLTIMDACLATKTDYVDTANYEPEDTAKFEYKWQWAYRERFEKAGITALLGSGFDPDEVTGVQVDLTAFGGEAEGGRTLSLSPDDPAWEELLSLLSSKWYRPYYLEGSSRNVTLDYTVQITISQPEAVFRYSLTGDKAIDLAAGAEGTRGRSFQVTDSQAFQQSVLDFLLEQEYTEQDARQE